MFICFWERDRVWMGEGQREGDTESEAGSRLWVVSAEPDVGLKLTSHEIMTWAEVGCLTDWATQAPLPPLFNIYFWESTTLGSWPEPTSRVRCLTDWASQVPLEYFLHKPSLSTVIAGLFRAGPVAAGPKATMFHDTVSSLLDVTEREWAISVLLILHGPIAWTQR